MDELPKEITHYFPAWTVGVEKSKLFTIGPVTFLSRVDWIDSVDFSEETYNIFNNPENRQWKERLRAALNTPQYQNNMPLESFASRVYDAISNCHVLLKVTVTKYEKNFSYKLARIICKAALDAVSLAFRTLAYKNHNFFYQQALNDEHLPPICKNTLIETNGFLHVPVTSLKPRVRTFDEDDLKEAIEKRSNLLEAFGKIITGVLNPSMHKHPNLAMRWLTALDWFAEGNREPSDAIAVVKFGICLDVLSGAGQGDGILDMVKNLTGRSETDIVLKREGRTLKQLIIDIYGKGRSQIAHGNHYDRLKSFETIREYAEYLASIVLSESAMRLQNYSGTDSDKAFQEM